MQSIKKALTAIDMTEGQSWKKLLLFTVPLLVGNLFQQLYSTADAIMLGRFVGDYALAAVGSSMPVFFLIMVLMMGLAMGAGIVVSQFFGAKRREELSYTIGNSITITAILGVILMVLGPFATRPLLILLATPYAILNDSVMYMNILLWGILGMAYFFVLSGILRSLGDAFSPLLYLVIACLLNIALNFVFIVIIGWGVPAVAAGTVLAQGFSSLLCLRRLIKMQDTFDIGWQYLWPRKQYCFQILKLGIPSGAAQAIIAVAAMVVQPLVNNFGPMVIAANVIVMQIDRFVMMPVFSFGNAITVYAGQNMGAGKVDRVSQGTKQAIFMAVGTAAVMLMVILLFGRFIAMAFTETQEIIDLSQRMIRIIAFGYIPFTIAMVLWGAVRGAGDAISPMWASIVNTIVVRVPTAYLFVMWMGIPEAIMYSMLAAWAVNMVLSVVVYRIGKWRTKGLVRPRMGAMSPPPEKKVEIEESE